LQSVLKGISTKLTNAPASARFARLTLHVAVESLAGAADANAGRFGLQPPFVMSSGVASAARTGHSRIH